MQALLVRVGIDASAGNWNAPVDPRTRKFTYIPIPEDPQGLRPGLSRGYGEVTPFLPIGISLPTHLSSQIMHLDPDFSSLTYGDQGQRASQILKLACGDLLVFYAGLRPIISSSNGLVYGLVGLYAIHEVVRARDVPADLWGQNAHTRRGPDDDDIVVRAQPGVSGRLETCIPIGEFRDRAYRVRKDILQSWGGLGVRDGYIQRSARLPKFLDPARFYSWFKQQNVQLVQGNN